MHLSATVLSWNTQSRAIPADAVFELPELRTQVVAVGTQEDRKPGSYLHSHVLPRQMRELGYELAGRTRFMGVGKTCYKSMYSGDLFARGCRLSCYVRRELGPCAVEADSYSCSYLARNKGGVSLHLTVPEFVPAQFVCCHLPFDGTSLRAAAPRAASCMSYSNYTLNSISEALGRAGAACYVFGDLNYRVAGPSASEMAQWLAAGRDARFEQMAEELDELRAQLRRGNLPGMVEGVEGRGPSFAPTAKLHRERLPGALLFRPGKRDQRCPSWTDRVLSSGAPACTSYSRFENAHTVSSDHAAVVAEFGA